MNDISRKKYKEIEILEIDFLDNIFKNKFDFLVLSGAFNLPGEVKEEEWNTFVFNMIEKMFLLCEIGISFNFLTTYTTFRSANLFYLSPTEVFDFVQTKLSRFCILNSAYPLYEVTCTVLKKDAIKDKYIHPDYSKYFK